MGLFGLKPEECPSVRSALRAQWPLLVPLVALVYLLMTGYTPLFAGLMALALTAVIILGRPIAGKMGATALRTLFWVVLGVVSAGFFAAGVEIVFALIGALIAICFWLRGGRETLRLMVRGLAEGAVGSVSVGIACVVVGVIIAVLTLTGLASSIATTIVNLPVGACFLAWCSPCSRAWCLAWASRRFRNYIITRLGGGAALLQMGVPLLVSHMFVFYFGIMADLTPPVALAAFAAAAIAQTSAMRIGWICLRIAIAGFVVPYMMVYDPALLMQGGSVGATAYVTFKALVAVGLWGAATIGYLFQPINWLERLIAGAAAVLLVVALPVTDELDSGSVLRLLAWHSWHTRRRA